MSNRWNLETMRSGVAQELKAASDKLEALYQDPNSTAETRTKQAGVVSDLKERLEGINKQIETVEAEAARKMGAQAKPTDEKDALLRAKAALYRSTMRGEAVPDTALKGLADNDSTGGGKFLPKTVSTQILTSPAVKNPLRGRSALTTIPNLEIPKLAFSLSDDSFIADGETAKEMAASGETVTFGRNKIKVFVEISETVLNGSDADLVSYVDGALEGGLAAKEKKVAFKKSPSVEAEKHMSFYNQTTAGTYDIKAVEGENLYKAIKAAVGDLEEDYRDNAAIFMRYSDYLDIIETLANGNATLYAAQPEQILGKPVVFCDLAEIPVIGDFSYSHYNYDISTLYDRDKNVKTGMECFVLTAWFDHQIKMRSAFRLAVVKSSQS